VLVQPADGAAEREMLGFETLTLAPIDRNLIEPLLLDEDEIAWLNAYHARVRKDLVSVSPPPTGRVAASISPSCASTEAWSQ
jgi:Xaa-Pro aminopeptidase